MDKSKLEKEIQNREKSIKALSELIPQLGNFIRNYLDEGENLEDFDSTRTANKLIRYAIDERAGYEKTVREDKEKMIGIKKETPRKRYRTTLPPSADERYDRASRESGEHHGVPGD
jgi:hypothetical protein